VQGRRQKISKEGQTKKDQKIAKKDQKIALLNLFQGAREKRPKMAKRDRKIVKKTEK